MKKHSVRRKSIALGLVVAVAILAVALVALQHFHLLGDATPSTYHWRGGASSTVHGECISYGMSAANCWIEAQNWVEGSVPPSASIIVIDNNSITSPAIPSGASVTLGTVTMDSPNHSITNYGTIYDGAFSGTINNYDNINGGIFGGTITNFGGGYTDSIGTIRGGSFTGTVFNNGTIDATGIYYGPPDFTNATFTDIMGTYQCPSGKTWNTNQCANPTYHWVGGHSNNAWNVASNWQENSVPAGGADIEIGSAATTNIVIPVGTSVLLGNVTISSFSFGIVNNGTITDITGTINNNALPGIRNNGTITNISGTFNNNAPDGIYNYGYIYNFSGTFNDYGFDYGIVNYGSIFSGTYPVKVNNKNDGSGQGFIYGGSYGSTVDNFGTIDMRGALYGPPDFNGEGVTRHDGDTILCPSNMTWLDYRCVGTPNSSSSSSISSSSSSSTNSSSSNISSSSSSFTPPINPPHTGGNTGNHGGRTGITGGTNVTTLGTPGKVAVKGVKQDLTTSAKSSAKVVTLPFHPSAATPDVSAGAWYAQAAAQAVAKGWMKAPNGTFSPDGTVTADDMAAALTALHINISTLQTLPRKGASVLSKGEFLQIMSEAFQSKMKAILKTKSQAEYSKAWNAISDAVSHHNAVRMSILAGWISMPQGSFHGAAPITRAEMAKILSVVVGK